MQLPQDRLCLLREMAQVALHYRGSMGLRQRAVDEVHPKVVIHGKEFFVLERCPKDASGRLEYDKKMIKELDPKLTGLVRNMCMNNPLAAQSTPKDTKADFIYKLGFCGATIHSGRVAT